MAKQKQDTAGTITAANATLWQIIEAHRQTGQVPPDALAKVRATAAALESIKAKDAPTFAAVIADLAGKFRALEKQLAR